jgi:hypothetical protein
MITDLADYHAPVLEADPMRVDTRGERHRSLPQLDAYAELLGL